MARLRARKANGVEYWELGWFGPDVDPATGKKNRHSRVLGRRDTLSKRDADLALKHLQRELFLHEHGLAVPTAPTVDSWRSDYLTWHSAEFPDSHYRVAQILEQHVPEAWTFKRLDAITEGDVGELKRAWRAAGYKDQTVLKHLRTVRAWLGRAADKGLIPANPAAGVEDPQILESAPHDYYDRVELEALYLASSFDPHHPDGSQHAPWHAPAWKWLANSGLRRGEALQQRRAWVESDHLRVVSTSEDRTKSGKWREIPLFPGAREALEALDALLGDREYVLPRVTPPSLSRAAEKCLARASLPGSLHTLRHTFISHLAMDPNVPVRTIQQWAGHANIKTTEGYMHLRRGVPPVALAL